MAAMRGNARSSTAAGRNNPATNCTACAEATRAALWASWPAARAAPAAAAVAAAFHPDLGFLRAQGPFTTHMGTPAHANMCVSAQQAIHDHTENELRRIIRGRSGAEFELTIPLYFRCNCMLMLDLGDARTPHPCTYSE